MNCLHGDAIVLAESGASGERDHRSLAARHSHQMICYRLKPHPESLAVQGLGLDPAGNDAAGGQLPRLPRVADRSVRIARISTHWR